jgi:hypothetical protein
MHLDIADHRSNMAENKKKILALHSSRDKSEQGESRPKKESKELIHENFIRGRTAKRRGSKTSLHNLSNWTSGASQRVS